MEKSRNGSLRKVINPSSIEFQDHTPVEKIEIIKKHFMRMWYTCHTGKENKAVRMAALQSEFIRVFTFIDPIEIIELAADEWIKTHPFMPTVAEFNIALDAGFAGWVPQEYLDKKSGLSTGAKDRVDPWDDEPFTEEIMYPEGRDTSIDVPSDTVLAESIAIPGVGKCYTQIDDMEPGT